jgi:type IV secretion system protein VirB11
MSVAIEHFLSPLQSYLKEDNVSELCINRPGELFLEKNGVFERRIDESLSADHLVALADLIAEYNHKNISKRKPLLSATLPSGERCQFVLPPATEKGQIGISIRNPSKLNLSIDDWVQRGAFNSVASNHKLVNSDLKLIELYKNNQYGEFVKQAVKLKKNIIVSGGTSTAKTTFLKSCLNEIPLDERLITIEGVREVIVPHKNALHLLANEDHDSEDSTTMLDLLKTCLRLRPDRIFLSELRSIEAYPFLRACISGHPGSLTTLHADTVDNAKEQLMFMLAESPELQNASEDRLTSIIKASIDIFIQMERQGGERIIRDIQFKGLN